MGWSGANARRPGAAIKTPRKILLLVQAGAAVDAVVQQLLDAGLDPDDLVVDCGNSQWTDTIRREHDYAGRCQFFGSGVSGGEVGARFGPSLMPGGNAAAWQHLEPMWNAIAAKVDATSGKPLETGTPGQPVQGGVPCTAYIGPNGAGHYVKMVHNGIEYVDMQLIGEAYSLLRDLLGPNPMNWRRSSPNGTTGDLDSYLIQITADILRQRDPDHPQTFLVDDILDTAQQKGTGKWTSINALDMGIPANAIAEAVFARYLSALKEERVAASQRLHGPAYTYSGTRQDLIEAVHDALYCAKICAYAQGFQLMRAAQEEYGWELDLATIASIWRGGCIIRARFLQKITDAYSATRSWSICCLTRISAPRSTRASTSGACGGASCPGRHSGASLMSALAYYDGYRSARLPANLLQAQRDYFGAHTYERTDQPRGAFFHLEWSAPQRVQNAVS